MELFTQEGGALLARYAHYVAGVTWIGLLYYFNYVQGPAFAGFAPEARTEATAKLVPRALWWFRWAALVTVISGFFILGFQEQFDGDYMKTPAGISISTGILFGLIMLTNVWAIIWRNQKIVIASAQGVLEGRPADPAAADAARRGFIASRTNTIMSLPLLFFMGFTSHLAGYYDSNPEGSKRLLYWIPVIIVAALLELNALGVIGGIGQGPTKKYMETHKAAIITGFVLTAAIYVLYEVAFG